MTLAEANGTIDDSLLLGWKDGKPVKATAKALSVSTCKRLKEDPHKHYLKKIEGHSEPESLPLAFGSCFHEALEAFYAAEEERTEAAIKEFEERMRGEWWQKLQDAADTTGSPITDRYNPKTPAKAGSKEDNPTSLAEQLEKGERMLRFVCGMLDYGWDAYTPLQHMGPTKDIERLLGEVAKERGMPYAEMELFDRSIMEKRVAPVSVIGGVPMHGYIDLMIDLPDRGKMIVDHKAVTHIVSYYSDSFYFPPSYNAADDLQLDVYSVGTGITRSGFQFATKQPQYVPRSGQLWGDWVPEPQWRSMDDPGHRLPMAWASDESGNLRYCLVWRPHPDDHPAGTDRYTPRRRWSQTAYQLRRVAEDLTESHILLRDGVDPEIAFPAGDPDEIAKKACPFCHFNDTGACREPRDASGAGRLFTKRQNQRRELADANSDIQERRKRWKALNKTLFP